MTGRGPWPLAVMCDVLLGLGKGLTAEHWTHSALTKSVHNGCFLPRSDSAQPFRWRQHCFGGFVLVRL